MNAALAEEALYQVVSMKESTTYQMILEEGAVAEAKKFLIMQGTSRFGSPDVQSVATLEIITDLPRLEQLGVRLLRVGNWQELLGSQQTSRRRVGRRRQDT
jgi:hypothetical protein